jgi:hypothetical protein
MMDEKENQQAYHSFKQSPQSEEPLSKNITASTQPLFQQQVAAVSPSSNDGSTQHGYIAKLNVSDAEADAILQLNGPTINSQPKSSPPIKLLIAALVLIALAVVASYLIGAYSPSKNPSKASSGGIGLPTQSNPSNTHGVTNQINKDVKTCSNPLNATLVC